MKFVDRHIGPSEEGIQKMLEDLGEKDLSTFISAVIPDAIRSQQEMTFLLAGTPFTEQEALKRAGTIGQKNTLLKNYAGGGYSGTFTPSVIARNILENPSWYTQYTPYQSEIAQGRLEALFIFQTLISDLTGLPVANASLLDEATAAAEAMSLCRAAQKNNHQIFLVEKGCHPQNVAVVKTRAKALGVSIKLFEKENIPDFDNVFGVLIQSPDTYGEVFDSGRILQGAKAQGVLSVVAADPLSLLLLESPGSQGADIVVGSMQRFGMPVGFGGPHAAFFATRDDFRRMVPGRIVGESEDREGKPAYRLALQTREQHIRRDRATSNICTAQVLPAIVSAMYAVYHGPDGLLSIANQTHVHAQDFAEALQQHGYTLHTDQFFDTLTVIVDEKQRLKIEASAENQNILLGYPSSDRIRIAFDETVNADDYQELLSVFEIQNKKASSNKRTTLQKRTTNPLQHQIFKQYRTETEFLRYLKRLERRDLSLADSMIPLGSCTMKLNATSELIPFLQNSFANVHPLASPEQTVGYQQIVNELEQMLCAVTGFDAVSFQPNSGAQGEYAGLLVIREHFQRSGQEHRNVCLIPESAHGTNPASAIMAGLKVVSVSCNEEGSVDRSDLETKVAEYQKSLAALMITYPSTHGVFEEGIEEICSLVHENGGLVYLDGANMNALVGLVRAKDIGADVCHINLHKTFCIPHGGGGPGMGPIAVTAELKDCLPDDPLRFEKPRGCGSVAAAPYGSASILTISWMYMQMMGSAGLQYASEVAILNANYIAKQLKDFYPVLYTGKNDYVAHECILDVRALKKSAGVEVEDIAKRLIDYGFHAPTISWPVPGTMMIEPTESESKAELDRFCEAMIQIRKEIEDIEAGNASRDSNLLKNAPHTQAMVTASEWSYSYSRELAAFPLPWLAERKFWPAVARVDNAYGDRNFCCSLSVQPFKS